MIKYVEIGNIKAEKNFPNISAHADMKNHSFVTADFATEVTAYATSTTQLTDNLFLVDNTRVGDLYFDDDALKQGDKCRLVSLKSLDQLFLDVDGKHINGGVGSINVGATLGVGINGNLAVIAATTGYAIYFVVTEKITLTEAGVRVQIKVA